VERGVDDARELEVAVLLGKEAVATPAAEIISTANFYDYSAKYESAGTRVEIPAKTGSRLEKTVRYMAIRAAKAIAVQGFCRVDFLLNKKTGELFVNEINTVPGMTEASAFPRLCEASGITGKKLITLLIEAGLAKFTEKSILKIEPRQYDI
jgi:D-alanine-D-alanine ligase